MCKILCFYFGNISDFGICDRPKIFSIRNEQRNTLTNKSFSNICNLGQSKATLNEQIDSQVLIIYSDSLNVVYLIINSLRKANYMNV
jgi:hypothetical protein